jgi:hypothetical protein
MHPVDADQEYVVPSYVVVGMGHGSARDGGEKSYCSQIAYGQQSVFSPLGERSSGELRRDECGVTGSKVRAKAVLFSPW